jgi:hypothetical protein
MKKAPEGALISFGFLAFLCWLLFLGRGFFGRLKDRPANETYRDAVVVAVYDRVGAAHFTHSYYVAPLFANHSFILSRVSVGDAVGS